VFLEICFCERAKITPKKSRYQLLFVPKEEENQPTSSPLLAEQDYPDFEIILIDDASSDNTLEVLEGFENNILSVW
jgi:hypothetical protein